MCKKRKVWKVERKVCNKCLLSPPLHKTGTSHELGVSIYIRSAPFEPPVRTNMHRHMTEKVVQNWKPLPEHRQLCADGFAHDTELQLLCIASGLLIAGAQRDLLAAATSLGGHVVDPAIIFCIIKLHWSCKVGTGFFTSVHLCKKMENLTCWHFPFLSFFQECSLDTLSSFTALLLTSWQEGEARGQEVHLPSRPSVLH